MARAVQSLHGPAQVSNVASTKYTVPANTKTEVRHIHVFNPSGSPVTFTMSLGTDAAGTRIYDAVSVPAGGELDRFCMYVLAAGTVIQAFAGTNNVLTLTINGIEYTLG